MKQTKSFSMIPVSRVAWFGSPPLLLVELNIDDVFDEFPELPIVPFIWELFEWFDALKKSVGVGNIWFDWGLVDSRVNVPMGNEALLEMLFKRDDGACKEAKNGSRVKKSLKSPPNDEAVKKSTNQLIDDEILCTARYTEQRQMRSA